MPDFTRKLTILSCLLFTGFCFWKAASGLVGGTDLSVVSTAEAAMNPAVSHNVLNIYVEGEETPIGVTAGHPIWSEDRQAFIHSEKLQPGERLKSALGRTVRITSIEPRAGPEAVYNLEVAGEHVYSVTSAGLLVHNTTYCNLIPQSGIDDFSDTLKASFGTYDGLPSNRLVSQFDTVNVPNAPRIADDLFPSPYDFPSKSNRANFLRKVDRPQDFVDAPEWTNPFTGVVSDAGHAWRGGKHHSNGLSKAQAQDVVNHADRVFTGTYRSGRPVDIYYKKVGGIGRVVVTEDGVTHSVITAYRGRNVNPARWDGSDLSRWTGTERYVEVTFPNGPNGIQNNIYPLPPR